MLTAYTLFCTDFNTLKYVTKYTYIHISKLKKCNEQWAI